MRKETLIIAGISVASTTVGVVAGYLAANKRLENKYVEIAEVEIKAAKDFYAAFNNAKYATPEEAVKARIPAGEILTENPPVEMEVITPGESVATPSDPAGKVDYTAYHKGNAKVTTKVTEEAEAKKETTTVSTPDAEVTVEKIEIQGSGNVFDPVLVDGQPVNLDEWDLEAEMENRERGRPYVITSGEFESNDDGLDILQMTYFAYDDTLVDEQDQLVDDTDSVVGDDNLKRFGHGSGDPKTVYVRNDRLGVIYDITRDGGSYAQAAGTASFEDEPEIRHSSVRAGRRLRDE